MFRRPGAILKGFATALALLMIIVSISAGICVAVLARAVLQGVLIAVLGLLGSVLFFLVLFCLGDMTEKMRFLAEKQGYEEEEYYDPEATKKASAAGKQFYTDCPACKNHIPLTDADLQAETVTCPYCGVKLKQR